MIIYDTIAIALICTLFAEVSGVAEIPKNWINKRRDKKYEKAMGLWNDSVPEWYDKDEHQGYGWKDNLEPGQRSEYNHWAYSQPKKTDNYRVRMKPLDCGLCLSFWSAILYCLILQPSPMNCIFIIGGAPIASVIIYGICKRLL